VDSDDITLKVISYDELVRLQDVVVVPVGRHRVRHEEDDDCSRRPEIKALDRG